LVDKGVILDQDQSTFGLGRRGG